MSASNISSVTTLADEAADELPEALPVGFIIGAKYEIKRLLGMGGNGAVYEGEHTAVGHRVAIKVVHRKLANLEETLSRFQREARICGSLRHPNVGQVYDVGTLDDGSPYMVMELQEGRSLGDILDETKLPIAAVIDIVRQLLAGLGAAHRAGAIHRDVKPDNVMIVRDHAGEVVVKLVDFGISKSINARETERSSVTGEGIIIGSPDYMPPEQLRGELVDVRTDLYATGVLLYEAITGRLPFEAEHLPDLLAAIMRDPVTRPMVLRPDCPRELETIVLKAISRDPAQRFQTADDMSRALAQVRAAVRNLPPGNLTSLSTPPPRASGTTARTHRRRTIDSHTLEEIRVHTGSIAPRRSHVKRTMMVAGGAVLAIVLVALFANRNADSTEHVTATPLAQPTVAGPQDAVVLGNAKPPPSVVEEPKTAVAEQANAAAAAPTSLPATATAANPVEATPAAPPPKKTSVLPRPKAVPRVESPTPRPAEDVQAQIKQAATAFVTGQTAQALVMYQRIVKSAPREADAWRGLGVAASRLGNRSEAVRAFQRYLALRPEASDAERVRQQLDKLR